MPPTLPDPPRPGRRRARVGSAVALAGALALAPSCGLGSAAVASALDDGDDTGDTNVPASVGGLRALPGMHGLKESPLDLELFLRDPESDPCSIELLLDPPGPPGPVPLLLDGPADTTGLATSPGGVRHVFTWDFAAQLPGGTAYAPGQVLVARVVGSPGEARSAPLDVGNDAPTVGSITLPGGEVVGPVLASFSVVDSSSDVVDLVVEFEDPDAPGSWVAATPVGGPPTGIGATPAGTPVVFLWDVPLDLPGLETSTRLRVTASDVLGAGPPTTSGPVLLDNNLAPLALVDGSAFFATSDERFGVRLPLRVVDPEGDPVQVVVQYRRAFETFPALPTDPAALAAVLADPDARLAHRIATERAATASGRVVPVDADEVCLPDLRALAAPFTVTVGDAGLAGRTLELVRPSRVPTDASSGWAGTPLTAPRAVVPDADGLHLLVLDAPTPTSWRLVRFDAATGVVAETIATGARPATALGAEPSGDSVLVAEDAGAAWALVRVDLASGSAQSAYASAGALALGPVEGLAAVADGLVLVTADDALVEVDTALDQERLVADGFAEPRGLAVDPRAPDRVLVAERDWLDPISGLVTGRVACVDRSTRERTTVLALGSPFERTVDVALDPRGRTVYSVTDTDGPGGTRELRVAPLAGGAAYELVGGLPDDATGLAAGEHGLVVVCSPGADTLFVGGGVQQRRVVASFDGATATATVDAAFDPAPVPGQPWRIDDVLADGAPWAGERVDAFVWDTADVREGGQIVLRATPYDTDVGQATTTGLPRTIRAGLDVAPALLDDPALDGVADLLALDVDDDGDLDLVAANEVDDTVTIHLQNAPGVFSNAPDVTLTGDVLLAPMDGPVALASGDFDADGREDLAVASSGSSNFVVFRRTGAATFSLSLVSYGTTLVEPAAIVAAELDGDGLLDVAVADTASDRVEVFFQDPLLGLFPLGPDLSLGDATTIDPSGLATADLDGDGDVDLVAANAGSDDVALYLQGAPGVFPASPSAALGGPGASDGPRAVVVADADGDGAVDVVTANRDGNDLTVFRQTAPGVYSTSPSEVVTHTAGPTFPVDLGAADVDGDARTDLVAVTETDECVVFLRRGDGSAFEPAPLVLEGGGPTTARAALVVAELDGDGRVDVAFANATADEVRVHLQRDEGNLDANGVRFAVGDADETAGVPALATGDVDDDGDLDLVCASPGSGEVAVYAQFGPAVFSGDPARTLVTTPGLPAPSTVACVDVDGDGLDDVLACDATSGELALFLQVAGTGLPTAPTARIDGGGLVEPVALDLADLDGDGDLDLVCADRSQDALAVFFQTAPGDLGTTPALLVGNAGTTDAPTDVVAVDLDGDGRSDLACTTEGGDEIAVFLQGAPGTFPSVPSFRIGGPGATDAAAALAAADVDGDGDVDLAAASPVAGHVAVFLQSAPGVFPAVPDTTVGDASFGSPRDVALADLDGDGGVDVLVGSDAADALALFRRTAPGRWDLPPESAGGTGATDDPRSLRVIDLDGDGTLDVLAAHPPLDRAVVHLGSH